MKMKLTKKDAARQAALNAEAVSIAQAYIDLAKRAAAFDSKLQAIETEAWKGDGRLVIDLSSAMDDVLHDLVTYVGLSGNQIRRAAGIVVRTGRGLRFMSAGGA